MNKTFLLPLLFVLLIPFTFAVGEPAQWFGCDDNAASTLITAAVGNDGTMSADTDTVSSSDSIIDNSFYTNAAAYGSFIVPFDVWDNDFTMTGWLKTDTGAGTCTIYGVDDAAYYPAVKITYISSTNYIQLSMTHTDNTGVHASTANNIPENTWHFYEIVHDLSEKNLYVKLNRENTYLANLTYTKEMRNTNVGYIGSRNAGGQIYDGKLDLIGIWDSVLTDSELDELYNSGSGLDYPFSSAGWDSSINGGASPSSVCGISSDNIAAINGVEA